MSGRWQKGSKLQNANDTNFKPMSFEKKEFKARAFKSQVQIEQVQTEQVQTEQVSQIINSNNNNKSNVITDYNVDNSNIQQSQEQLNQTQNKKIIQQEDIKINSQDFEKEKEKTQQKSGGFTHEEYRQLKQTLNNRPKPEVIWKAPYKVIYENKKAYEQKYNNSFLSDEHISIFTKYTQVI